LWERSALTGNWCGTRDELAAAGYTFDLSSTQIYQGVAAGGVQRDFAYFGRNDYYLNVNGEKAGLWKGFFIDLHGESRYGETINNNTGAIMPANLTGVFPVPNGSVTALTQVKFTQALSENLVTFAGKINLLDNIVQPYSTGRGVDSFMNLGVAFPIAIGRGVPYSTLGAGMIYLENQQPVFTMLVLDPNNSPTTSGFENFFKNGATILARVDRPVSFRGLPGHQGFWSIYSSGSFSNFQPTAYLDPEAGLVIAPGPKQTGSWAFYYSADQALYVDPCNSKRSWGLFTNIGLADNGPSPVRWAANVGVGGSSPLVSRPLDTFGVGYAYTGYSGPIQTIAPALLPIQNDQAVELFYNYAVTPWFRLTPDLQILVPAKERTLPPGPESINTAIVFGLRAKIIF
jgi:porin